MQKLILTSSFVLSLSCAIFASPLQADAAADAISAIDREVTQRVAYLDEKFGVLLTYQEQQNLKIALIAKQVTTAEALAAGKTSQTIANEASNLYQINDQSMQRQLLIEVDAIAAFAEGGGGGIKPQCC